MTVCKRAVNKVRLLEKANATLGCIAYVTQDIILSPNTAPVSGRGTTATHSEHRSSSQTGTAREMPQQNYHQTQTISPERLRELGTPTLQTKILRGERKSQFSLSTANRISKKMFDLQQGRFLCNRKLTAK